MHDDVATGFLAGGGTMGAFVRAYDWRGSALGVPTTWSQSLRTAVRLLLNTQHPMLLLWGPRLTCIYNEAFRRLLGPDRHPAAFAAEARVVFDDLWPVFGPRIEHVLAGHGATWDEAQTLAIVRGAAPAHWTYSLSPIDDEQTAGGIAGVLLICTDVSQVHAAHASLAMEHSRLLELFRQAPGFIASARGPEHVVEMANDAYRALVGPDRPLVGRPVREALPELAGQGFFELLDQVYRSGEAYVGEAQPIALARGTDERPETRYISFVYAPVRATDGSIDGVITEGHDLTALMHAESALRQARDIDLIGRLAAGVAHDFNNLLTVILGNSELLVQSLAADDALQELAQTTYTAAERGADLTRRLLAIGRQQNLAPRAVDIPRCLREARDFLARVLPANITLDITATTADFVAWVDPQQFEHAVLNLCVNARDAMPAGGRIDIDVSHAVLDRDDPTTGKLRPGRYVCVSVRDSGPGMDAATAVRAFEPFFSTKPSTRGSGLGLATVQGFAEQSGGRATLDSAPGCGTTVTLHLPTPRADPALAPGAAGDAA